MRENIEKVWENYFFEICSSIETQEEKELAKKAISIHEEASKNLTREQNDLLEKYIDALCGIQNCSVKNAFFKGCKFATEFLLEILFTK